MPTEDWKYQISLALPEGIPDEAISNIYDIVEDALRDRDGKVAEILEARANELQAEWEAPPSIRNGFITMSADTPAGYATFWGMHELRSLAKTIKGDVMENEDTKNNDKLQCADCEAWIDRDANHTCKPMVRRNRRNAATLTQLEGERD